VPRIAVAVSVIVAGFLVLALTSDFLVDWVWFSAVGYLDVFRTILGAKAALFLAVFTASAILLWLNGFLALRLARRDRRLVSPVAFWQEPGAVQPSPEPLEMMRQGLPWRLVIAAAAGLLGILIAAGEISNWDVFLRFIYQVPYGQSDPLYGADIGFYLFSLPAYIALKNWLLLTLILGFLLAAAVYWVHGDIEFDEQRQTLSTTAIAHGSVLLGLFFAVKAWSYDLGDRGELHRHACRAAGPLAAYRVGRDCSPRVMGQFVGAHL
jgi:uncharacterized protein